MAESRKLKFGHNFSTNKSFLYANFGVLDRVIVIQETRIWQTRLCVSKVNFQYGVSLYCHFSKVASSRRGIILPPGASISEGIGGGPDPPKDMHWGGVQRVKDPPMKINMFAIYHEY